MTVIAWDGTTLAADKLCHLGITAATVTKVVCVRDAQNRVVALLAFAGSGSRMWQVIEWLRNGAKPEDYPPRPAEDESALVAVTRTQQGRVIIRRFDETGYALFIEDVVYADGGFRDIALAAMACGKTAREAIEVTAMITTQVRGVDTLTFDS